MATRKAAYPPGTWVLLALLAGKRHSLTPVELQKTLFLLGARRSKEVGEGFYRFEPYDYGPFAVDVYRDADRLAADGLVAVDLSMGKSLRQYRLTAAGLARAKELAGKVPERALAYLREVVAWAQSLSFNELVRAIYEAYPKMRARSVFRDPA